ncbi:hypothetical protein L5515_012450 [Caenorhabditis briggsae]|uniref:Uncharacterized protein n=1 Tax=Caenorhabditis briggsae TaxID=6238 RepID=A0AAE9JHV2_CAEBR|nr:hypothetical protein L5515_012450 [Caenorhabditis briggsae]
MFVTIGDPVFILQSSKSPSTMSWDLSIFMLIQAKMRSVFNQMHKGLHFQTRAKVDESEEDSDDEQDDEEEEYTVSNVEAESSKRNLNAEDLILPFNCCHNYKKWRRIQVMEFFSQRSNNKSEQFL